MLIAHSLAGDTGLDKALVEPNDAAGVGGNAYGIRAEAFDKVQNAAGIQGLDIQRRIDAVDVDKAAAFAGDDRPAVVACDAAGCVHARDGSRTAAAREDARGLVAAGNAAGVGRSAYGAREGAVQHQTAVEADKAAGHILVAARCNAADNIQVFYRGILAQLEEKAAGRHGVREGHIVDRMAAAVKAAVEKRDSPEVDAGKGQVVVQYNRQPVGPGVQRAVFREGHQVLRSFDVQDVLVILCVGALNQDRVCRCGFRFGSRHCRAAVRRGNSAPIILVIGGNPLPYGKQVQTSADQGIGVDGFDHFARLIGGAGVPVGRPAPEEIVFADGLIRTQCQREFAGRLILWGVDAAVGIVTDRVTRGVVGTDSRQVCHLKAPGADAGLVAVEIDAYNPAVHRHRLAGEQLSGIDPGRAAGAVGDAKDILRRNGLGQRVKGQRNVLHRRIGHGILPEGMDRPRVIVLRLKLVPVRDGNAAVPDGHGGFRSGLRGVFCFADLYRYRFGAVIRGQHHRRRDNSRRFGALTAGRDGCASSQRMGCFIGNQVFLSNDDQRGIGFPYDTQPAEVGPLRDDDAGNQSPLGHGIHRQRSWEQCDGRRRSG